VLREQREDDAEKLAAPFAADPGFGWLIGFEKDPDADFFRRPAPEEGFWGRVIASPEDEVMGFVNLHKHDSGHRRIEVGIWLIHAFQGRGAGADALRRMSAFAFDELDVQRVQLTTLPDNEPMIRCAERVGFQREGVLRSYTFERGKPVDNLMCSLLRGELAWPG
jgi:RimJ/RimL family protein N-acetyltransferase